MFPYVAHLVRNTDGGEEWQAWIGTAPSEEAVVPYIEGLIHKLNERDSDHWALQTYGKIDLDTATTGGQVMVSTFFYRDSKPVIKMVQATDAQADSFAEQDDIAPDEVARILDDDKLWWLRKQLDEDDFWRLNDTNLEF